MMLVLSNPMFNSGIAADTVCRVSMMVPVVIFLITATSLKLPCWDAPNAKRFDMTVTS